MRARVVWVGKADDDRLLKVHHQMPLRCLGWRKRKREGHMTSCHMATHLSGHIYPLTLFDTKIIYQVPRNSNQSYSTTLICFLLSPDTYNQFHVE